MNREEKERLNAFIGAAGSIVASVAIGTHFGAWAGWACFGLLAFIDSLVLSPFDATRFATKEV